MKPVRSLLLFFLSIACLLGSSLCFGEDSKDKENSNPIWTLDAIEWTPLRDSQKNYYIHRVGSHLKTLFPNESWSQKRLQKEMKVPESLTDLNIKIDRECDTNKERLIQNTCAELKDLRIKTLRRGSLRL